MARTYDRSAPPPHIQLLNSIGICLLRIGAGFVLFYAEGLSLATQVWQHLWHQAPWAFIDTVESAQLPMPKVVAITLAISIAFCSVSLMLGFVTRFVSTLMLPVTAIAILIGNRAEHGPFSSESFALYFFIAVCLLICGPGVLSVDALFKLRRKKKSVYV